MGSAANQHQLISLPGRLLRFCVVAQIALWAVPHGVAANEGPVLANAGLEIRLDPSGGQLEAITDTRNGHNHVAPLPAASLWRLVLSGEDAGTVTPDEAASFHWTQSGGQVRLVWERFDRQEVPGLRVVVTAEMDGTLPSSRWQMRVDGLGKVRLSEVHFPCIEGVARQTDEVVAAPVWMGERTRQARALLAKRPGGRFEWGYPGTLSLQCVTVYREGGPGLYVACDDTAAFGKRFAVYGDAAEDLGVEVVHLPEASGEGADMYETPYDSVIGVFEGDWFDAAAIYRAWALEQPWARDSRLKRGTTPEWVARTGLWIWNRGRSENVLGPAAALQEASGLPVSVFWHWWHGCAYDVGFPEYLPPREGAQAFQQALAQAHERGLHAIVYMNQRLWGMTTQSWREEDAGRFAVKDARGEIRPEIYNTFTQAPCASMCMGTRFWREKYAGIAAAAFDDLHADGIYMDQACSSLPCFDASHGHPLGGGTYWMEGFRSLAGDIRRRCSGIALAGEGCGEAWLPHLDMMLSLQVSMERYAGPNGWEPIPFFHAVYHGYGVFYGNYSSLTMPPYDALWPSEFAPAEPLKLLDRKFSAQFRLEQARAFVWGQQPTIANFLPRHLEERAEELTFLFRLARLRSQALKYLLDGTMLAPPRIDVPSMELDMSRLSIYAGQRDALKEFRASCPAVLASAWQAPDGDVAAAVVNISDTPREFALSLPRDRYPLPDAANICRITENGREACSGFQDERTEITVSLAGRDACLFEFTHHEPERVQMP